MAFRSLSNNKGKSLRQVEKEIVLKSSHYSLEFEKYMLSERGKLG